MSNVNEDEVLDRIRRLSNIEKEKPVNKPGRYTVVVLNDHVTPFEVAVEAVMSAIRLSRDEAERRMHNAHTSGGAAVAVYGDKGIAETKADQIMRHAQQNTNHDDLRPYTNGGRGWNGPWPLHAEVDGDEQ